jgi:hypothetical protein
MITRRNALQLAAAAATCALPVSARSPHVAAAADAEDAYDASPVADIPASALDAFGDYELTINLDFDFQDYSDRHTSGETRMTYGQYVISAGRENGAWRMHVQQVLADDDESGEHIFGPELIDVRDQTDGPDPLALLQGLLGGQAVLNGTRVIRGLSVFELRALAAASSETKAALIGLMQRNGWDRADHFATRFGRWALTASAVELDGFWHSDASYRELAARVRGEKLAGKALFQEAANELARAQAFARHAERALSDDAA